MFTIRPRKSWGAAAARSIAFQRPADIHTLVIHHTVGAAPSNELAAKQEMRSIQRMHMAKAWSDIGYNYVIDRAGRVWEGRGMHRIGAHTAAHNTGTIGISFMGNYETMKPNLRQLVALRMLKRRLRTKGVKYTAVRGHNQMPNQATACPGRNLTKALGL